MKYKYSYIDQKNLKWFQNDVNKVTLISILLRKGHIRGLNPFEMAFKYPISVIAGKNGSGKSTILALAACAFHNKKKGFKLPKQKNSYYTHFQIFLFNQMKRLHPTVYI